MKHLALLACLLPLFLHAASPLPVSTPAEQGFSPARLERLHTFLSTTVAEKKYPGIALFIARNGQLIDQQTYGSLDLAGTQPMSADAIYRIYSMSKPIVSVAVLSLMEEGKLSLEDPVSNYLPEFKTMQVYTGGESSTRPATKPITIRHLLTHTSGLARTKGRVPAVGQLYEKARLNEITSLAAFSQSLAKLPLACEPGTEFHYGLSTDVLGRLIEVVSGQSFEDFLRARIFNPLGMTDTGFTVPAAKRARIAQTVTTDASGKLVPAKLSPDGELVIGYPGGGGGLYSTGPDYLRFAQMILNGGELDGVSILGRKTVELMLQNHLTQLSPPVHEFSPAEGFGLGGYVVLDPARRGRPGSVGQFGWSGAASTYFTIDPQEKLVAILMFQHLPQDPHKINGTFYTLVYQALVNDPTTALRK